MFDLNGFLGMTQKEKYQNMLLMLDGIIDRKENLVTNLSNASSLINALTENVSWCGFYILEGNELRLGPFQGLPACTRISMGKGVCGSAASKRETIIVEDVNKFPGHIACDAASNSEIVIPIIVKGELFGVLDIDSTSLDRFNDEDKYYLEKVVRLLEEKLK